MYYSYINKLIKLFLFNEYKYLSY